MNHSDRSVHLGIIVAAALLCAGVEPVPAQVRIGDAGGGIVEIEIHDASVREILEALKASQRIQFRTSLPLQRTMTGTYSGTIPQVLSRILEGHNYFLQVTATGTRLHIIEGTRTGQPAAVRSVAPEPAIGHRISDNLDLEEERSMQGSTPRVNALPLRSALEPRPAVPNRTANGPASARVSTNVDLDEESSR